MVVARDWDDTGKGHENVSAPPVKKNYEFFYAILSQIKEIKFVIVPNYERGVKEV